MLLASRKWYWFGIGAILLAGIGVAIGTAAGHRDAPNFADTVIRICAAPFRGASAEEALFFAENSAAMSRMMIGIAIALDRKEPSGDVDRDFVAMMSAHHQGAIDMAEALLLDGRNERLRRLTQEFIVTQQQEIAAMRLAAGESLPPPVPDQIGKTSIYGSSGYAIRPLKSARVIPADAASAHRARLGPRRTACAPRRTTPCRRARGGGSPRRSRAALPRRWRAARPPHTGGRPASSVVSDAEGDDIATGDAHRRRVG
jgi:Domain of unknown function (DUF305)